MNKIESEKMFFHPICNKEEIERIFNIKTSQDYLLKLRAETIVDNMRLFRVYRNKALVNRKTGSMETSFDNSHYKTFLTNLDSTNQNKCNTILAGNIFSTNPNGKIFKTDYGLIITLCDSLRFFFKFMNLALMDFEDRIPDYVCVNSLRIAIRIMLKTETLDFLMDPRGIVPSDIGEAMHSTIPYQMQFIAGHEYAHYLLNHVSEKNTSDSPIFNAIFHNDKDYKPVKIYNQSQNQEFDADINSIMLPTYTIEYRKKIVEAALIWFGCLDLYESVLEAISPTSSYEYKTHPPARDRFTHLLSSVPLPKDFSKNRWDSFLNTIEYYKGIIIEDVALHIENYEMYGSVYLDKPNSEWRGPELRDRIDYY